MSAWIKDKVFANADDFLKWLDVNYGSYISDHISENHVHHTYIPNHSHYTGGKTTLQLHQGIRNSHINSRGWDDIGQHITVGKNGDIVLGRDIQKVPCSATGYNGNSSKHPFMYETIGNFDVGNDKLEGLQLESVVKISRYFNNKGKGIGFHREKLINGKQPKSCPGTGIDKNWFMNLVKSCSVKVEVPLDSADGKLVRGERGENVKQLNLWLNELTYTFKTDDLFDQYTEAALIAFQKDHGLPQDGIYTSPIGDVILKAIEDMKLKQKEEEEMLEKAIVINGTPDFGIAEPLAARLHAPIYTRASLPEGKIAKEVYVVGGSVDGLNGDKIIALTGKDRYEVADAVNKFLSNNK